MFDREDGILGTVLGSSESPEGRNVDTEQIWVDVKSDGRSLGRKADQLNTIADSARDTGPSEISEPERLVDEAENAAETAKELEVGVKSALSARKESALEDDETYDIVDSVSQKIDGLAGNLEDAHQNIVDYGEEVYDEAMDVLRDVRGLDVDLDVPDSIDWNDFGETKRVLGSIQNEYRHLANTYSTQAKISQQDDEHVEERAEDYRELEEQLEGSEFQEEYGRIAEALEEKADAEGPVTPEEKAEKASLYSSIAEHARDHLKQVYSAAEHVEDAAKTSRDIAQGLDTILTEQGYREQS